MSGTTKLFNCPACGAPLEPPAGQSIMKCNYCKGAVVIPDALKNIGAPGTSGSARIEQVVQALYEGNKIEAIKIFRSLTDATLVDAKNIVDAIERGEAIDITRFLTSEQRTGRSLGSLEAEGRIPPPKSQTISDTTFESQADRGLNRVQRKRGGCVIVGIALVLLMVGAITLIFINGRETSIGTIDNIIASVGPILPTPTPSFATSSLSFGEEGTGAGMLNDPRSVGVDSNGNIVVGDYGDGRIQIFDAHGNFLKLINTGNDVYIGSLAVAPDGSFYACYGGEVHRYDASGQEQGLLNYASTSGLGNYIESIAIGADGSVYAVSSDETIVRFGADGSINMTIPEVFSAVTDHPELDMMLAVDGLGNIYVLGSFNTLVLKYSSEGRYLDQFGGDTQHPAEGVDPGRFQAPDAIAVDGYGRIYVSDVWGVQVFDSNGQFLDFFEVEGVAFGMIFDLDNNLYIASNTPRIIKYQIQRP